MQRVRSRRLDCSGTSGADGSLGSSRGWSAASKYGRAGHRSRVEAAAQ